MLRKSWWSYWRHTQPVSAASASRSAAVVRWRRSAGSASCAAIAPAAGPVVERRGVVQRRRRHVGRATAPSASRMRSRPVPGDAARRPSPAPPSGAQMASTSSRSSGLDDGQHPLLALRGHDLERLHARLAPRHGGDVDVHAHAARGWPSRSWRSMRPAPPRSWMPDHEAGVEQRQARLDEPLLLERIADLHARPLGLVATAVAEPGRRPARSRRRCRRGRWSSRAARPGCPRRVAWPSTRRSVGSSPRHSTLTSGLPR